MRIQHNVTAMNSYRNFNTNNSSLAKNLEKLSSGYKINRAGDDAAGLAISEKMRAQISGLEGATKNAKDGISLVQTAEGALTEVHDMLNRMYTLAEQSANGTYEDAVDRSQLQKEVDQLRTEIDRIADSANFNGLKLLDGSLAKVTAPEDSIRIGEMDAVDYSDGVSVEKIDGVGATSQFELSIDKAFGAGDKLTLRFEIPQEDGSKLSKTLELEYSSTLDINDVNAYDNDELKFGGVTKEEQLASILGRLTKGQNSDALGITGKNSSGGSVPLELRDIFGTTNNAEYNDGFTVTTSDGKLNFIAEAEAKLGTLHLSDVEVTNVDAGVSGITLVGVAANTNEDDVAANGVEKLVTGNKHYMVGDKLQFEFNLADAKTATATVEITEDMIRTDDTSIITNNIVEALKQTNFEDNKNTAGFDESQFKVSDFFDVKANVSLTDAATSQAGSVSIRAIDKTSVNTDGKWFKLNDVKLAQNGSVAFSSIHAASGTMVASDDNAGTTDVGTAGVKTVGINQNLAEGDTFTLEGKLADGRAFSVELTAGKTENASKNTFAVKDSLFTAGDNNDTLDSIAAVLNGASKVTVTNSDGSTVEMKGGDIFGTNGTFSAVTSSADGLVITNRHKGAYDVKGLTGDITFAGINATEAAASGAQTQDGVDATPATMSLTFDKADLEYGTAVTIGTGENAKTFELVESDDSDVTEEGNIRVVVANLDKNTTTSETIAAAFKTAIDAKLNDADDNGKYSAWAGALGVGTAGDAHGGSLSTIDGATITLTNATAGSASTAAEAGSTYGEVANVTLGYETDDEGKMKLAAGDTLVINGTTYQFDTTTRNLQGDNKLIRVSDFSDQKDVAEAIALAVNEDFKGKLSAKTNDDNTVTISGVFDEATQKFTSPSIEQSTVVTGGGLTLQIGDTSEDFNKLTVNIRDMHTDSIGTYTAGDTEMKLTEGKSIKDIDISTQDGAADALDVIKNAINMVSDVRGTLGASQNRLEHTINNLGVMRENIQNAESAIRDTDVAEEMMAYTKNNILVQSAQAMLAQANQLPQGVLQLLG